MTKLEALLRKKFKRNIEELEYYGGDLEDVIENETAAVEVEDSSISCGVCQLYSIVGSKCSALQQALILWGLLRNNAFVLLSDTSKSNAWKETKKFSLSTVSRKNPNTKNQIKVYIADINTVKSLVGYK